MSSSTSWRRGTITSTPAVALSAAEMYTAACGSPARADTSGTSSAVRNPMLQIPGRGYSSITTVRKALDCENTLSAKLFTPPYTAPTIGM
jgi:hypothetical protein